MSGKEQIEECVFVITMKNRLVNNTPNYRSSELYPHIKKMLTEINYLEKKLSAFRKMNRRDWHECGTCGKDFHTLDPLKLNGDCPWCSEIKDKSTCLKEEFDPKTLVEHIDSFGKNLNEWEVKFIADLIDNPPEKYSKKQITIINRIYNQKC